MARLVMAAATPHNPLLWRAMVDPLPDDLVRVAGNFALIADEMKRVGVEVIVAVGSDHVRQFFADLAPAFVVGKAERYHGVFENEVRAFGMPYVEVTGHRELGDLVAGREVLPDGLDLAVSHEWRLDHGFVLPLLYLTPGLDLPVLPIHVNTMLAPLPGPQRFAALGRHLRRVIESWSADVNVMLLTSGHMATDIGGPRLFLGGGSPDPDFDAEAVGWMRDGDLDAAIAGCRYDRVSKAGNVTYQYLNAITALAAMDGRPAELAEATESRFASSPFFVWSAGLEVAQ